jgi:pyrroline-5-carboxylate reductase
MLIRSLFVATISSHRFLLIPALSTLQFLTRPHASALFSVEKNPVLHAIIKKTFYNHFCGGENGDETRQCVKNLKGVGFRGIILTYARETVFDHETQITHALLGSDHEEAAVSKLSDAQVEDVYVREWKKGAMESLVMISSGDFLALK